MSTPIHFRLRLLRASAIGNRIAPSGATVDAPAIDAAALIRSGHAVLADLGPLLDALPASANLLPRAVLAR